MLGCNQAPGEFRRLIKSLYPNRPRRKFDRVLNNKERFTAVDQQASAAFIVPLYNDLFIPRQKRTMLFRPSSSDSRTVPP